MKQVMEAHSITPHPTPVVEGISSPRPANGAGPRKGGTQVPVADKVTLSPEARTISRESPPPSKEGFDLQELTQLQQLKRRDSEVRTHEQAHLAAAGRYAKGGPSFTYTKGPDGNNYAVGGEVGIDVGKESTPEATIMKMQTIKRAALAPANPSPADRSIAAEASIKEAQARQELMAQQQEELLQQARTSGAEYPEQEQQGASAEPASPDLSSYSVLRAHIAAYEKMAQS